MPLTPLPALAYWRTQRALSQQALAKHAGVRLRTIQLLEYGRGTTLKTVQRLAEALDVPADDLIREPPGSDDPIVTPPARD